VALDIDHLTTIGLRAEAPSAHHLNLMAPGGQRLSIYLDHAPTADVPAAQRLAISSALHDPFLAAANLVFMHDDGLGDPVPFLRDRAARGALLAVCTMGSRGALAVSRDGTVVEVTAAPATVVDTHGAGDAFVAGVIDHLILTSQLSSLEPPAIRETLAAGARQAAIAVGTHGVGPVSKV